MPAIYSNDPNVGIRRMLGSQADQFIPRSPTGTPSDVFSRMYTPAGPDPRNRRSRVNPTVSKTFGSSNSSRVDPTTMSADQKARWMAEHGDSTFGFNVKGPIAPRAPRAPSAPNAPKIPKPLTVAQVADGIIPWSQLQLFSEEA